MRPFSTCFALILLSGYTINSQCFGQVETVVNGEFEPPVSPVGFTITPDSNVPGWSSTEGLIELFQQGFAGSPSIGADGLATGQHLEITVNGTATVSQTIVLPATAGTADFSFDTWPRAGAGVTVSVNGSVSGMILAPTLAFGGSTVWTSFAFPGLVVAGGETITLNFTAGPGGAGDHIDQVSFLVYNAVLPSPAAPTSPSPAATPVSTLLVTDLGAIYSAMSGLQMARMNLRVTRLASQGATRDLNERNWEMRAGMTANGGAPTALWGNSVNGNGSSNGVNGASTSTSDDLRYLRFAATQLIDYRVALGLADGEEVELVADTLSTGETVWAGHPFAMLGGPVSTAAILPVSVKAVVAAPEGSGKNPYAGKEVVEADPRGPFEIYTAFDYGYYDQDNLTQSVRGFDVDNYAGSLGAEVRVFPWLAAGAAFTHTWSNSEATADLGSVDLEGQLLSGYATALFGHTFFDALYSYGDFDNEINRNTLLGSRARGDTDSFSHNISLNAGHNLHLSDQIVATPYLGWDYSNGGIDGYVEKGGGNANLIYPDDNFESMVGRLGGAITYTTQTGIGTVRVQGRAAWAHEFMPESDTVSASLQTSPFALVTGGSVRRIGSFTATENGAHPGTDWLELGAGVRLDLGNSGFHVQADYEGQFGRNNASAHFGSAKVGYEW